MVWDPSSTGYAANLAINDVQYNTYKSLSEKLSQKISAWREISATEFALKSFRSPSTKQFRLVEKQIIREWDN